VYFANEANIVENLIGAGKRVCWRGHNTFVGTELPNFAALWHFYVLARPSLTCHFHMLLAVVTILRLPSS